MPPLPAPLAAAFEAAAGGGGKRERTQAQLILAAVKVLAARGQAAATINEVAQVAGMTTATVMGTGITTMPRPAMAARSPSASC